jgi:hypothetical protein
MDDAVHLLHINDNQLNTYTYTYIHISNTKLYLSIGFLNLLRFQSTVSLDEPTPSFLYHFNKFFLQYFFHLKIYPLHDFFLDEISLSIPKVFT